MKFKQYTKFKGKFDAVNTQMQKELDNKDNKYENNTLSLNENNEKITVKELDHAYLQKHNELMTVYKAYQTLFSKTVGYKDELGKYKQLPTGSLISRSQMDKLIADQGFVMNMIDKMQDQLINKNIISNTLFFGINYKIIIFRR